MAMSVGDMSPGEFADLVESAEPSIVPSLLRERFRIHVDEFCKAMWPERFERPFSRLHVSLFKRQTVPAWNERRKNVKAAVAAPRGYAKSTIQTFARLAHDIVYDREAYIVIISAGQKLARNLSRDLRNAFTDANSPLVRLYGPFTITGGVEEWEVSVRGRPPIGVVSASFGSEVRGIKHPTRGIRPTKVVMDDSEKKDRVRNPEQRTVWWNFLMKDVLKLGDRGRGTVYEVAGTILHIDSMLSKLMTQPGWETERWQAIEQWPIREDLWERCRDIWADLTLGPLRAKAAEAFYKANRREMERGAKTLDPAAMSLFDLYELMWSEGRASFLSELQNDPIDPTEQVFFSERFARFQRDGDHLVTATGRRVPISRLRIAGFWDPALGNSDGDYAAIAIMGRDEHGYMYVLDCWMRKAKPSEQLDAAWLLAERWGCGRMIVESNGFAQLVAEPYMRQRKERESSGRFWRLQLEPESSHDNKEMRIAALEPGVTLKHILFNVTCPAELFQQFDTFPNGAHDDGPDAVQGAWKLLGGSPAAMRD